MPSGRISTLPYTSHINDLAMLLSRKTSLQRSWRCVPVFFLLCLCVLLGGGVSDVTAYTYDYSGRGKKPVEKHSLTSQTATTSRSQSRRNAPR